MKARYGIKEWGTWKPYVKNKKIRVDYITGEYFESGRLAPETYKKVMAETREIQKKMKEAFSPFLPKDKEITGTITYSDVGNLPSFIIKVKIIFLFVFSTL